MAKRKEDVAAQLYKQQEIDHHHDMWLSNIVALVVVLVFGVYTMLTRDALTRLTEQMNQQIVALQAQCAAK
jgi:hypothetical protein